MKEIFVAFLLCILCQTSVGVSSSANVVNVQVQPQEFKYNTNGILNCFILLDAAISPDISDVMVLWYHNNDPLDSPMDLQQINDTYIESNITINNIQLEDAGNYTCSASIGNDGSVMEDTKSVCVGVFSIDTFSYTNLMVGSRAEIQCGNVPGVNYTWRGPTNEISNDPIIIQSLSVSDDESIYTCIANIPSNPMNCQTQEESIVVNVIDTFVQNVTIRTSTLIAGNHDTIICEVYLSAEIGPDYSSLTVEWYHNGINVNSHYSISKLKVMPEITFTKVDSSNAGTYTCSATIRGGDTKNYTKDICVNYPKLLVDPYTNLTLGSNTIINCRAMDSILSDISVYWIDSNNIEKQNPLYLSPVALRDNNTVYTCFISIHHNPNSCIPQSHTIEITIKDTFVKKTTIFPTNFIIGTPGILMCGIVLNIEIGPDVSSLLVEWYHNNNSISNNTLGYTVLSLTNNFAKEFNSTLKISQVESSHSGKYTCVARIGEKNLKKSSEDICVNYQQPIVSSSRYTGLTLGDSVNILCTSQELKESEATVTWIDPNNHTLHNPLMSSPVSVSLNNTRYTCNVRIHDNPSSCENNTQDIIITIKDTYVIQVIITPAKDTKPNNLLVGQLAVVNCMNVLNTDIGPDMSALHKEWYHNNEIITTDIRQRGNILQLQLKKVKTSFAGYYECVTFIDDNTRRNESDNILLYVNLPTPLVTIDSQNHQVYNTSTSLDLTCSASISSSESPYVDVFTSAVLEWRYIRGESEFSEIFLTSQNDIKMYTSSLSLHNINLSSAGEYTCDVYLYSNFSFVKNSTHESNKTTIRIKVPTPDIILNTTGTLYDVGTLLILSCKIILSRENIDVNTIATIKLYKKDILNETRMIPVVTEGENLTYHANFNFSNIKLSDSGIYKCESFVDDNIKSSFIIPSDVVEDCITVNVKLPTPKIILNTSDVYYVTGSSLVLRCQLILLSENIDYDTRAAFQLKNDNDDAVLTNESTLPDSENETEVIYTSGLQFNNLKLSNAGNYTCTGIITVVNSSFVIQSNKAVDSGSIFIKIPTPDIILNTTGGHYNLGTLLNMSCKIILRRENIDVNTMATIKLYNKDILRETRIIPVVTEGENLTYRADFHFSNIKLSDSGIYKCEGFVDGDINSSFIIPSDVVEDYITINVKIPTPEIILNTSDVYYDVGSSLVLSCQMILLARNIDNDTVAVFELKSSFADVILFSETIVPNVLDKIKLIYTAFFHFNVLKLSDAGEYTCTGIIDDAMNSSFIIQSNKTIDSGSIFIKMLTGSPINCTNTTFLPRTVTLVWTEPEKALQNEEISGYYLECRIEGSETQIPDVNITQDNPDTNYTIPVLIPFTSYRCLLTAINQVGQGPSTMCAFTTAQDIPENAPENVSSAPSRFDVTFTWLPPSIPNGIIIQYNLTVDNINTGTTITHVVDSTQDHETIGDFKPYQKYSASLSAGTVAGYGPAAYVSGRTKPDIPGAVATINLNVLNISTIQITWSLVAQEETNGNITHYIVSVSLYEGRELYNRDVSVSNDLQVIVNGLAGEIPYGVTVRAVNDIGQEGQSNTTVFFTREEIPPIPTNISVLRLNGTHMNISWSLIPITKARGFIQSYFILYQENDNRKRQTLSVSVPATDSSVVIGGLDPGKSYSVLISASTNAGQGAFTSEVVVEESKSSLFQLRAEPFTSCEEWTISTENSIKSFIRSAVVDTIQDYCECGFLDSFITNETLFCDTQNPTQVVYRAKLFNFGSITSTQLVSWIEDWVLNGASVTSGPILVTFDPTCPVPLNSINDRICQIPVTTQSTSSVGVIAGSALAVAFIVLICIVLFIIVILYFHLKSKKERLHVTANDEKNSGIVNIELESNKAYEKVEFPPDETVDHTYESLENYENVGRDDVPQELNGDTSNQPVANVN